MFVIKLTVYILLFCYGVSFTFGFLESDAFLVPGEHSPYSNQVKLLVSNNYHELLTVYDSVWLASLWPKLRNGVHLHLDDRCWKNLTIFFQDLLDGRAWALNAVDATGSFSSGLLWGNRYWIGSHDQCNDLDNRFIDLITNSTSHSIGHIKYISSLNRHNENTGSHHFRGDEVNHEILAKMVLLDNTPPFRMGFSAVLFHLNITKTTLYSSHKISMGICLPKACQSNDVHELIDFSIKTYQNLRVSGTLPRSARVIRVRTLDGEYNIYRDPKSLLICSVSLVIVVLIIIGTVIDVRSENNEITSEADFNSPSFKSFIKTDQMDSMTNSQDSEKSLEFNSLEPRHIKGSHCLNLSDLIDRKGMEPFHTIDGLIPNKYTEIVTGLNLLSNTDSLTISNLNNRNHVNLVTVKKIVKKDSVPTITLDIIAMKNNTMTSNNTLSSEHRTNSNKTKYVLTTEELSPLSKVVYFYRNTKIIDYFSCIDKNTSLAKILTCFSLKTNLGKIFYMDIGEDTLAPIHGMKVITLLWVILIHTCLVIFQLSDNKVFRGKAESNFLYQTISNGTYSVDTFFVLSGLLVSYLYCQTMKKYSSDHLINFGGVFGKLIQLIAIVSYRYIRLSPPYLLTIGLVELSSRYLNAYNLLELPGKDYSNCLKFWWRNALYINTFYPLRETCMSWSWYLANDTQFYVFGVIILMVSIRHVRLAAAIVLAFLVAGWSTTAVVSIKVGFLISIENPLAYYDELYDKPWTRVGPYLIGLCTGWLLSKNNCCLLLSKTVSISLWAFSLGTLFSIIYGLYGSQLGVYGSVAYISLSHTAWGLAISWIIVACVTGYGGAVNSLLSCRYLYPLSRLSFCAYLLHPMILKVIFVSSNSVQHVAPETLGVYYLGFVMISFAAAFIVSLMFEAPAVSLLRLGHPMRRSLENDIIRKP